MIKNKIRGIYIIDTTRINAPITGTFLLIFSLILALFYAKFNPWCRKLSIISSAFKHGVTKDDIVRAFETFIYEDMIENFDNKHLLLGFNLVGNLIEIMYNRISNEAIKVFHAMPCRKAFREMILLGEFYGKIY